MKKGLLAMIAVASNADFYDNVSVYGNASNAGVKLGIDYVSDGMHHLGESEWKFGAVYGLGLDISRGPSNMKAEGLFGSRAEFYRRHSILLGMRVTKTKYSYTYESYKGYDFELDKPVFENKTSVNESINLLPVIAYQRRLSGDSDYWAEASLTINSDLNNTTPVAGLGIKRYLINYN